MHKMPRIWKEYLEWLTTQKLITDTRRTFDRALRALPLTQHMRWIWPSYISFIKSAGVPETAIRVYRRYLKVEPTEIEDYINFLSSIGRFDEAAQQLAKVFT
jgi:pre-mRNA-splicing factor SYF1